MAEAPISLSEASKEELQKAAIGGIAQLKEYLQKKNKEWKNMPLNIGITGDSGVGKSSFINAIRGLSADDEGGAHVDVVEATRTIKPYKHPKYESMIFWDLPGVGTPNFSRSSYLEDVKFHRFDFFLILSAGRFREDDLWLAKEIRKLRKNFHFVRTQMGVEVEKDKKSHPKTHSKTNVIEKVRTDCFTNLDKHDLSKASVFLIDNYATKEFDFNSLTVTLIDEAPSHKREAMVLSVSVLTEGVLKRKVEELNGRIYKVSLLSAISGTIPIPGMSASIDGVTLLDEVTLYKTQLGLDQETMEENARLLNTEARLLEKKLGIRSAALPTTAKGFVQAMARLAASESIVSILPVAIPLIGNLVCAGISYGVTVASLEYFLKMCADDARQVAGAIPIPGVSACIDCVILAEEVMFYKNQLGLDRETSEENVRLLSTEARLLEKKLGIQSAALTTTVIGLVQIVSGFAISTVIESVFPIPIPLLPGSWRRSYSVAVASLVYFLKCVPMMLVR